MYVENQPIGRTDRKGRVLLDRLRPYDTNQVSLDPAELPLDASLSSPTVHLTPPIAAARSCDSRSRVRPRRRCGSCRKTVSPCRPAREFMRPGGDATVALDGLIFLTDAAGYNEASASWPGHRCRFSFQRPEDGDPMPDLGEVRVPCHEPVNVAGAQDAETDSLTGIA